MINKELSANATGIALKETKVSVDNRKGVVTAITINPTTNSFTIEYQVQRLDANGNVFTDVKFLTKKEKFRDKPEFGTVDYNDEGMPIDETYSKVEDENLFVTNWYNSVGKSIMENAIKHIEFKEGL